MEDLSDIEFERYLQENNAAKWFCNFGLIEPTPLVLWIYGVAARQKKLHYSFQSNKKNEEMFCQIS